MALKLAQSWIPAPAPAAAQTPPRGVQWIDLHEASRRSGLDPGYLRRRCSDVWLAAGLARSERREGDTKHKWYVRDDADPALSRVKSPEQLGADLSRLTDAQRRTVADRKAVLDGWERTLAASMHLGLSRDQATDQYLNRLAATGAASPSRRTLYYWHTKYRRSGLSGLADGRANPSESEGAGGGAGGGLADEVYERVKDLWLTPRKWSVRRAYDFAMGELMLSGRILAFEDVAGGSYTMIFRRLQKIPKAVVTLKREGQKAFTDAHEPYIERDYSTLDSNSIWCGDHHRFDVLVAVPDGQGGVRHVRPWLTAWQDLRSRKIVGYHVAAGDPNTDTILRAFRAGAQSHGVPLEVMIDNGKDYDARALQGMTKAQRRRSAGSGGSEGGVTDSAARLAGVFPVLGVAVRHVQPYHGQSKPIERFFGTLADRFSRQFETYVGHTPSAKPEDLARQLDLGAAPALEDFARDFADWLEHDYHLRGHTGDAMGGRCPAEVFTTCLVSKRAATAEQLHFACMPRVGPVAVRQNGVTWNGMHYGAYSPEVAGLIGRKVMLAVDLDDVSRVVLVSDEGRMLCVAPANERLPVNATAEDVRTAMAQKRKTTKVVREYQQRRTRLAEDTRDGVLRAARERAMPLPAPAPANPDGGPTPPPSVSPVRTPFDDQLADLARLRPAAGEELAGRDTSGLGTGIRFGVGRDNSRDDDHGRGDDAGADYDTDISFRDLAARGPAGDGGTREGPSHD